LQQQQQQQPGAVGLPPNAAGRLQQQMQQQMMVMVLSKCHLLQLIHCPAAYLLAPYLLQLRTSIQWEWGGQLQLGLQLLGLLTSSC